MKRRVRLEGAELEEYLRNEKTEATKARQKAEQAKKYGALLSYPVIFSQESVSCEMSCLDKCFSVPCFSPILCVCFRLRVLSVQVLDLYFLSLSVAVNTDPSFVFSFSLSVAVNTGP